MSTHKPTFDEIPAKLAELNDRMERIERLLEQLASRSNNGMDEVMEVEQAAHFLKLSTATLYSKVSRGELPCSKRGKKLVFSKKRLTEWSLSGERQTLTEKRKKAIQKMQEARQRKK